MSKDDYIVHLQAEVQDLIARKGRQESLRHNMGSQYKGGQLDDNLRLPVT